MKRFTLIFILLPLFAISQGQSFKLVTYNSLRYSTSNVDARHPYFRTVINGVEPDILVLQEISGQASVTQFLDSVMNFDSLTYSMAPFTDGNDLDCALYYKTNKFTMVGTANYPTVLRDIFHYKLRPKNLSDTLHVFGVHLKASTGTVNQNRRKAEVDTLRKITDALPTGSNFIVCGDFNIYSANEPAYTTLLQVNSGKNGEFNDAINITGTWNNSSYAAHHTQSPRDVAFNGGASGGMDDRFDLILFSDALNTAGGIRYKSNSLNAYGNDGNRYDAAINGLPLNSAVGQTIADAIYYASDHIPVEATFEYGGPQASTSVDTILIAEYDRANASGCVTTTSYSSSNISITDICRGSGVTYNSTGSDYNTRSWPQVNTLDQTAYLEFAVSPSSNYNLYVSQIKIRMDRSGTGPSELRLRSSVDGYVSDLLSVSALSTTGAVFTQNLSLLSSEKITFRLYGYNASSSAGTFDIEGFSGTNISDPGIQLMGYAVQNYIWNGTVWNTGVTPSLNLARADITVQKGSNPAIINNSVTANRVVIEEGAALAMDNGTTLTVSDTLFIKDGASGYGQLKGKVTGKTAWLNRNTGPSTAWYFVSFPIDATVGDLSSSQMTFYTLSNGTATQANVYYYKADTINPSNNEGAWLPAESTTKSLKGAGFTLYQGPPYFGSFPIDFQVVGNLNSGTQTIGLKVESGAPLANRGWNLVPNPYPCSLDWGAIKNSNPHLDASFYILDNETWKSHNGSLGTANNFIPPGQSFFVKTSSSTSLTLTEAMTTVASSPTRFKQNIKNLELEVSSQGTEAIKTWIAFDSKFSWGFDKTFDGLSKFNPGDSSSNLSSTDSTGEWLVFNGLPTENKDQVIDLEFSSPILGAFQLSIKDFVNDGSSYFLFDQETNDTVAFSPSQAYVFTNTIAGSERKFQLFKINNSIGLQTEDKIKMTLLSRTENGWNVKSEIQSPLDLKVFDLSGKQLMDRQFNLETQIKIPKGIYILRLYNPKSGAIEDYKIHNF